MEATETEIGPDSCQYNIIESTDKLIKIQLGGELSVHSSASVWQKFLDLQKQYQPEQFIIDANDIQYCDGAGVSLLIELREQQLNSNKQFSVLGLPQQFADLYKIISDLPTNTKPQNREEQISLIEEDNLIENVGHASLGFIDSLREGIAFLGEFTYQAWLTILKPRRMRWRDVPRIIEEVGPNAFPIIALMGFLIGIVMSFEAAIQMENFGATIYVPNLVGLALTRELGPLMAAILITGRSGSAFAAELGTMKINQEVDALHTMGLDPVIFLAMPRLFAVLFMTPVLYLEMVFFGLIGGAVVFHTLGYSFAIYINQLDSAVRMTDLLGGLVKCEVFGIVIASIGCMHGLRTRKGARSVGLSTTQAVVNGIILLIVMDGLFAIIYYALGI